MAIEIWAVVEHRSGEVCKGTFEALGLARKIAASRGAAGGGETQVVLVVAGEGTAKLATTLTGRGADRVVAIESAGLEMATAMAPAGLVARLAKERSPETIVICATSWGRDMAARLSARLSTGLLGDVTAVDVGEGGTVTARHPVYAGKIVATISTSARPQVISGRPKVFDPAPVQAGGASPVETLVWEADARDLRAKVKVLKTNAGTKVALQDADVIVSGGRGLKGPENFKLLEDLADVLQAAVGASRAAVDAGWREHSAQVGQTGRTVTPKLYIACGISGAIQHLVGMSNSKVVIAINKDKEAPIFKRADYGIADDLFKVVPALTEALKKATGAH